MRFLLSIAILVMLTIPQQAIAFKQAPMGLKWGMKSSSIPGGVTPVKKSHNYLIATANNPELIKIPKIRKVDEVVLVFANGGLQKVAILFSQFEEDVMGTKGKELYFKIKTILIRKYGQPPSKDIIEVTGKTLYRDPDEFYQCLNYAGCGLYWTFIEVENMNVSVELKGYSRGTGQVVIQYENEGFRKYKDSLHKKNLQETESNL